MDEKAPLPRNTSNTTPNSQPNGKYDYYSDYAYDPVPSYHETYRDYDFHAKSPVNLHLQPTTPHDYLTSEENDHDLRLVGGGGVGRGRRDCLGGRGGVAGTVGGGGRIDNGRRMNEEMRELTQQDGRGGRGGEGGGGGGGGGGEGGGNEGEEGLEGPKRWFSLVILLLVLLVVIFVVVAIVILYLNYMTYDGAAMLAGDQMLHDPCQGVLCPMGECRRGQCVCPNGCRSDQPVCGSDGLTYASRCHLERHACSSSIANLTLSHTGPCQTPVDPCDGVQCRAGAECRLGEDGETECRCLSHCPQDDSRRTVCGSDGTDYSSECELSRTSCLLQQSVKVRYPGMCDPCGHMVCLKGQVCLVDEERVPRCLCNSTCPSTLSPVCGSDGTTYSNECMMNFEACRQRKTLTILYRGECSSGVNPCREVGCRTGQVCMVNQYGVATCQCPMSCAPVVTPVCGTDDVTYESRCHLDKEACVMQRPITVAFVGSCGSGGPCDGYKCEFGGECVERYSQAECECPECRGEYRPVCGSDRRTYHSPCILARHACRSRIRVDLLHQGPCDACKDVVCGQVGVCRVDAEGVGRCSCLTNCSQALGGEVCGSNGETYASECHLQIAACTSQRHLTAVHKGSCDLCKDVYCKFGARCEGGRCICPTDCPDKKEPVCGSDRITYSNECVMRKVACEKNEDLNYMFFGECNEIGGIVTDVIYPTPLPPASPEDPCHSHTCIAGAECRSDGEGRARCVCDIYCSPPPRYEPVCGSDMEFYESECLMRLHACNIQVQLFVVPVHECATSQRSRACNGTSPLSNPSTGEDLFCGEGGTICPPGTYCHRGHHFAKCCRDYSVRVAVIEAPEPDDCHQSEWGCCADGINFASGPEREGCPESCRCHKLGSVREPCDAVTGVCECRPGVGGKNCDRCLPGYYGLNRVTEGAIGCTPCGCSLFGSLRTDCMQMTGECVCKPGVSGHQCTVCPKGQVLRPEGCVYEDLLVPAATTCGLLQCHFGGQCQEKDGVAACTCANHCLPSGVGGTLAVCGSDGVTYASECEVRYQACVQQADIVVVAFGSCAESWTDAPVRRSTAEDGWSTDDWAWPGRGLTEHHGLATRRHVDAAHSTRAHSASAAHSINSIIDTPGQVVTPKTEIDSEEDARHPPPPPPSKLPYSVPSFSGNSYIQMMTWSVPTKVQVEVEFSTHEEDGVLLYVQQNLGGNGDFLALVLSGGYLEARIDLGNGRIVLKSPKPVDLFTRTLASVRTYGRDALLQMGVGEAVSGRSEGIHRSLDINAPLYVGGVPSSTSRVVENLGVTRGFFGCIHSLRVGQRSLDLVWGRSGSVSHAHNVSECRPSPCAAHPCLNGGSCRPHALPPGFTCTCLKTHTGRRCEVEVSAGCRRLQCPPGTTCQSVPTTTTLHCVPDSETEDTWPVVNLKGSGYLALPRLESEVTGVRLEVWMLARAPHGMLLYAAQGPARRGDFLSLNLAGGFLQFRLHAGSSMVNLTTASALSLEAWHRVKATWESGRAILQVDDEPPVTTSTPGPQQVLHINTPIYLGGFKLWYLVNRESGILVGLDGALQRLLVNDVVYPRLTEAATEQRDVGLYLGPPCHPNPCFSGGLCVPSLGNFSCRCPVMFAGKLCQKSLVGVSLDQPIHFDGSTSVLYPGQLALKSNKSGLHVPWSHPDYDYLEYDEVEQQLLEEAQQKVDVGQERVHGRPHGVLEVSFRAEDGTGLLLWAGRGRSGRGRAWEYLTLALVDGFPQLALNLGRSRKPFILTATGAVDDGSWHVVRVTRRWRRALLKVDNHRPVRGKVPRGASSLHTDGNLWLGGLRWVPPQLPPGFHWGFRGCVDRLLVDGREVHLVHHAASPRLQFCQSLS